MKLLVCCGQRMQKFGRHVERIFSFSCHVSGENKKNAEKLAFLLFLLSRHNYTTSEDSSSIKYTTGRLIAMM